MPGPWEDYAKSPQPQSGPWQDYGSVATVEPPENKEKSALDYAGSFATGLIPDTARGIYHTVVSAFPHPDISTEDAKKTKSLIDKGDYWAAAKHVVAKAVEATPGGSILTGAVHNAIDEVRNATKFYDAGDTATAANHLSRALPVIGPMIGGLADVGGDKSEIKDKQRNVIQEASQGDPARMLGQIAGMVAAPKLIEGAVKTGAAGVRVAPEVAKVAKEVATDPNVLKEAGGAVGGALGATAAHATGVPYAGYAGAYFGRKLGKAVTEKLLGSEEAGNIKTPAPPPQEPYASPGGIPTGPDLTGGGSAADILAADLARRRAAKANTPTPPSAPAPPDQVNGVPAGASEPLPASPSRQLNAGPIVRAMPPVADTSGIIKGWQPTILENENLPVQQAPAAPQAPIILPEWEAAAKAMGAKDFSSLPEGVKNAIRNAKIKPAPQSGVKYTPAPEANAGTEPQASAASEAQARRLEKDRQEFLQTLEAERANQVAEAVPEPAQPEPVSTSESQATPPAALEPKQEPIPEPATPVQPEVAPVQNPRSGQANPIPKDFGPTELSDMPIRPGHAQIRSSTVHSVGYDPETGHAEIHFKKPFPNGGLYRYPNLPQEELLRAVQEAPSFGAWTREVLRANPEWTKGYKKIATEENPPLMGGAPIAAPAENTPPNPRPVAENPVTGKVVSVPTNQISVDPNRFQFKANVGQGGAGEELRSVKQYDPEKAGVQAIWKDPANGKTYIVNGHNRLALAQRTGTSNVNAMYLDAKNAAEARTKGALINIAEGRGTAIDAAKVFRDNQVGPEELAKEGISPTGTIAKTGMALANLDPSLFSKVVSGEIPIERASIIGEGVTNPADQKALYDLIRKREASGKSVTNGQIGEMIRFTNEAPTVAETQESLFGSQEMTRSLIPEKAEVSAYIRQQLSSEKKLFQAVANGTAAEKLGTAGNVIKAEENAKVALTAAQAQAIYDKLSTSAGPINEALDAAAQAIAKGSNVTNAKTIAYQKIKSELFKQAQSLTGTGEAPR